MDLWITPEIQRRQEVGQLPRPFSLSAAEILFEEDADAPTVRLNAEVKGLFEGRVKRAVKAGEPAALNDFEEITDFSLSDHDSPNGGHITLVVHRDRIYLFFDARYNARRIATLIVRAHGFLDCARLALNNHLAEPVIENLFTASELAAKCLLLTHPDRRALVSKKHGFVRAGLNKQGRLGNVPREHVKLLNQLSALRPGARYGYDGRSFGDVRLENLVEQTSAFLEFVETRRPKRL